ncbi:protein FAM180B isoform X1 [Canis lupus dingo]|uniref:protein FAM180B isoform X1 n=1 Tax=Canis lupus dingo TaxID=286419 RepID=UPI0015F1A0EB|nr:protein FAM180B isoform X1 [Canis lupus dingo]XP_038280279.1 protein FAM180B isoform X1 [Canis lupus familiaris]
MERSWKSEPAPPSLALKADTQNRERLGSLQWKLGAAVCGRMQEQRAAGERNTQRTWWGIAGTMQLLAWLIVAICLLPGVTTTQHHPGKPMDSASLGGGLQEPEAPEVMFELLWAGLELDVMGQLHIQDEELASTHPGRRLRLLLQHHVPSDLEGAKQRLRQFQDLRKGPPLSPWDFEHLLLTGLSCVYRLHKASEAEERGHWAQVFALLAQETLWDLCKGFCPQGQPPSLGPWALILDPFP